MDSAANLAWTPRQTLHEASRDTRRACVCASGRRLLTDHFARLERRVKRQRAARSHTRQPPGLA
eukprot:5748793-Prymnesium_polylepis.1